MRSLALRAVAAVALVLSAIPIALAISDGDGGFYKPPSKTPDEIRRLQAPLKLNGFSVSGAQGTDGPCPLIDDVAAWKVWRDRAILQMMSPRGNLPGGTPYVDADQVSDQGVMIANALDDCLGKTGPDTQAVKDVLGNFALFARTQSLNADTRFHQFGHDLDDAAYIDRIRPAIDLPPFLRQSNFLLAVSNPSTYASAKKLIDDQNATLPLNDKWLVLTYASQFLTTPDPSKVYGRFLVMVPGHDYDRWIQFGIRTPVDAVIAATPGSPTYDPAIHDGPINNVSIVAIAKSPGKGQPQTVAQVDWWRIVVDGPNARLQQTRRELMGVTGNCQQCHQTGLIGIHPSYLYKFLNDGTLFAVKMGSVDQPLPPELATPETMTLDQLTARWRSYGAPKAIDGVDTATAMYSAYGPPLGPVVSRNRDAVRATCGPIAKTASDSDMDIVISAMNCASCHSSAGHGALTHPLATTSLKQPDSILYQYIMQGLMPPPRWDGASVIPPVAPRLREMLHDCLVAEYYNPVTRTGTLVDWFQRNSPPGEDALGAGQQFFHDNCAMCHEFSNGPNLKGVFGRAVGAASFANYSPALKWMNQQKDSWDEDRLREFIFDPGAYVVKRTKGAYQASNMPVHIQDQAIARELVDYLKTYK